MSEAPDQGVETPAPEAAEIPAPDAPEAVQATEAAGEAADAAGEAPGALEAPSEEPRKPKSPVAQLQGRVGHLTKTLHEKDSALAERERQIETYKALLAAQGKLPEGDGATPAPTVTQATPAPGTPEFDRLVEERAALKAAQADFDRACNGILDTGKEKYGSAFEEGMTNLNALGLMSVPLIQAAMATGAAPDVLNALGSDTEEAARITALPPVQMAVELAKLSTRLQAPREGPQISRAPAPISPIGGQVQANLDVYDPHLSDDEYYRRRAAQGARFVRTPK